MPPIDAGPAAPPADAAPPTPEPEPQPTAEAPAFDIPPAPVVPIVPPAPGVERPEAADAAEQRLVAAGLSAALAADVVGEAVTHGLPFSAPRNLKKLIRAALARRIPDPRPSSGPAPARSRSSAPAAPASPRRSPTWPRPTSRPAPTSRSISLRGDGTLANRLHPLGIGVISADDAAQAKQRLGARKPLITLIDTPAAGASTTAANVKKLATDLRALKPSEVHLALPGDAQLGRRRRGRRRAGLAGPDAHRAHAHGRDRAPRRAARAGAERRAARVLRVLARRRRPRRPGRARPAAAAVMSKTAVPALVPGQKIVVRNVHIGTLPATIDRSDASSVTVALAVMDDRIKRLVGHEMAVEVISGRGIHRFGGVLTAQNAGSLTISLSGDVERIQRREFVRIGTHLAVTVQGVDEDIGGETTTLDVSGSGMRITDNWQLPLGLDVRDRAHAPRRVRHEGARARRARRLRGGSEGHPL